MTLRTLSYGNYGIFLVMGNAGFIPSTVVLVFLQASRCLAYQVLSSKMPHITVDHVATQALVESLNLGPRVVPFCPVYCRAPLLKPNSRKKGTLIIKRLLRNQEIESN